MDSIVYYDDIKPVNRSVAIGDGAKSYGNGVAIGHDALSVQQNAVAILEWHFFGDGSFRHETWPPGFRFTPERFASMCSQMYKMEAQIDYLTTTFELSPDNPATQTSMQDRFDAITNLVLPTLYDT